ncbi:carbohydrate ABC transporter permease [Nonomuraea sp. K274]|uniref:Carbohydrate ABC transporter permease n=1 Tax=Nonomuraea cypriaca TaxID=1187855 RepID=A0A931F3X8_9ACTN|nr:carbohydrate ABC transporter permease [Nonomuraea cypriaca]MBF8194434.1 carbohydrate ABC transporter permease [Nonomuraea cypriaca]
MKLAGRIVLGGLRLAAILVLLFTTLLPFAWMLSTAFKQNSEILVYPPRLLPTSPTLDHFKTVFLSGTVGPFFLNSLMATVFSTALTLVIATPAAYALAAHRFPRDAGRHIGLGFLLLRFLPPFAIVIPLFVLMRSVGLIDTVASLVIVYTAFHLPLAIWMIQPAAGQIPRAISEAASVDGAGPLRTFWNVVLPLLRPSIATAAAFCTIFSWNEFFFALILTTTKAKTFPVLVSSFVTDSGPQWGTIAATSLVAILPIIVLCVFLQRHLVSGLTAGAVR